MKLGVGRTIAMQELRWADDVDVDERTPRNARRGRCAFDVTELEWTKPHQRLIVRGTTLYGQPVAFTRRELEINGARNG